MVTMEYVRSSALAFPRAEEHPHFEKTSFRVNKKIFATLDEKKKIVVVKLSPIDQSAFCAFDTSVIFPVPGGWGKQGWTMIDLSKVKKTTFNDALKTSYNTVTKK